MKDGQLIQLLQKTNHSLFTGVLSAFPYYIAARACENAQFIHIFSPRGQMILCYCFPNDYKIRDIAFHAYPEPEINGIILIILAVDSCCCPCVLKCRIKLCGIRPCVCKECCRDSGSTVNDLLESIALIETALSHILNAEGEKLQKAVEIADNVCELLEIDKAVNKTIRNITFLEQTLYAKLEAVSNMDPEDCCEDIDGCDGLTPL